MSKYAVLYSTERFTGAFYLDDLDAAISTAIDVLMEWMMNERTDWDPDTGIPTPEQRDSWNRMIGTSTVFVYAVVPGKESPDEEDVIWDMEDDVLREIGWKDVIS